MAETAEQMVRRILQPYWDTETPDGPLVRDLAFAIELAANAAIDRAARVVNEARGEGSTDLRDLAARIQALKT